CVATRVPDDGGQERPADAADGPVRGELGRQVHLRRLRVRRKGTARLARVRTRAGERRGRPPAPQRPPTSTTCWNVPRFCHGIEGVPTPPAVKKSILSLACQREGAAP